MRVTVAICTWNRAELLDQTLTRMRELRVPTGVEWELLVVNNNCTDGTDAVIAKHQSALPAQRLWEPRQGLSQARNAAVAAARGELVIWTDDDVLVDVEWLERYVEGSRRWPEAGYFGGTVDPWFSVRPPRWFSALFPQIADVYAVRQLGEVDRPFTGQEVPFGANMAFRTEMLRQIGFDHTLGHCGKDIRGGEEVAVVDELVRRGHRGIWLGTAKVQHYIPAERIQARYLFDWHLAKARRGANPSQFQGGPTVCGAPRWLIRKYWQSTLHTLALSPWKGRRWYNSLVRTANLKGIVEACRQHRSDLAPTAV